MKTDKKGHWKRGVVKDLANEACMKFNVNKRDEINADTIQQRFNCGKPDHSQCGPDSIFKRC